MSAMYSVSGTSGQKVPEIAGPGLISLSAGAPSVLQLPDLSD
jgi:hypothetical protein